MATSTRNDLNQLTKMSKPELLDRLERQNRILTDKKFVAKLPDKGHKIRCQIARLEKALSQHVDIDETTSLFQRLGLDQLKVQDCQVLKSNDDIPESSSVISTIAAANGTILNEQHENLIKARSELNRNVSELNTSQGTFVDKMTQRLEPESGRPAHLLYHFRPNRELRSMKATGLVPNTTTKDKPKQWYETAVTPPPAKFDEAQLIPLKDSYQLTKNHEEKLMELTIIQATEKLGLSAYRGIEEDHSAEESLSQDED